VEGQEPLTWRQRLHIVLGVARALVHVHSHDPPMLHGNVESGHVLLTVAGDAKLSNFGMQPFEFKNEEANFDDDRMHTSTFNLMPPEYHLGSYHLKGRISEKTDSFAFGVILLEVSQKRGTPVWH
jgi:serine/threonine protein kinase